MNISKQETIVINYAVEGIKDYVVTRHSLTGKFILYKIINNDYQKLKMATSPIEFDEIVEEDRSEI